MTYRKYITAILETCFAGFKEEMIECACNRILEYKPKVGHWIEDADTWIDIFPAVHGYRCSECKALNAYDDSYCPNCGIKMEEKAE